MQLVFAVLAFFIVPFAELAVWLSAKRVLYHFGEEEGYRIMEERAAKQLYRELADSAEEERDQIVEETEPVLHLQIGPERAARVIAQVERRLAWEAKLGV